MDWTDAPGVPDAEPVVIVVAVTLLVLVPVPVLELLLLTVSEDPPPKVMTCNWLLIGLPSSSGSRARLIKANTNPPLVAAEEHEEEEEVTEVEKGSTVTIPSSSSQPPKSNAKVYRCPPPRLQSPGNEDASKYRAGTRASATKREAISFASRLSSASAMHLSGSGNSNRTRAAAAPI